MRKYLLGIALCFALVGCSAKQKIYDGAHKVQQLAISSRDLAVEITELSTQPEVVVLADQIMAKQEEIHTVAEDVRRKYDDAIEKGIAVLGSMLPEDVDHGRMAAQLLLLDDTCYWNRLSRSCGDD